MLYILMPSNGSCDLFVMSNECVMSRVKIKYLLHNFLVA